MSDACLTGKHRTHPSIPARFCIPTSSFWFITSVGQVLKYYFTVGHDRFLPGIDKSIINHFNITTTEVNG
jgi:hypothetical protein